MTARIYLPYFDLLSSKLVIPFARLSPGFVTAGKIATTDCVARATLWFCPGFFFFFFSYAADLSLFLETGKGLTCAVFTESVDLRPG